MRAALCDCFGFGLCSGCFKLFGLFALLGAFGPELCPLQSAMDLLPRTHSMQSAMNLLCRTHSLQSSMGFRLRTRTALSVFSCSGLGAHHGPFTWRNAGVFQHLHGGTIWSIFQGFCKAVLAALGAILAALGALLGALGASPHVNAGKRLRSPM